MARHMSVREYMEKHKISHLFEDLMNKVVHDMPDEPVLYLIKALYKKAKKPIPDELRFVATRKSLTDLNRSRSPEATANMRVTQSAVFTSSQDHSPTRKGIMHDGKKNIQGRSFDDVRKARPEWDNSTRLISKKSSTPDKMQSTKAWASIGLENEEGLYSSGNFQGPQMDTNFSLENEFPVQSRVRQQTKVGRFSSPEISRTKNYKVNARISKSNHKRDLAAYLASNSRRPTFESGFEDDGKYCEDQDDAIELLEDADELAAEGVKNIPPSGYKLSKILRERREDAKVNLKINLYPERNILKDQNLDDKNFDRTQGFTQLDEEFEEIKPFQTPLDDEFESISQVTGPRRPVWEDFLDDKEPSSNDQYPLSIEEPRTRDNNTVATPVLHPSHHLHDVDFSPTDDGQYQQNDDFEFYQNVSRGWIQNEGSEISIKPWRDPQRY